MVDFASLFPVRKPIIGMIHLAGATPAERVQRALAELQIYDAEGVDGAIIENYHGSDRDVRAVLEASAPLPLRLVRGVNILGDPYSAFALAAQYGARFVQFDSVQTPDLDLAQYDRCRTDFPQIAVLGGVGFKYTSPTGNPLEQDLAEGKGRCEAIVTTGEGTGIATPLEKLVLFKKYMGAFPLIVGAGVTAQTVFQELAVADGAIIGSYFKPEGNTMALVDPLKVREVMSEVYRLRARV